jgi:ABC-type multidrug transport system permease subunit
MFKKELWQLISIHFKELIREPGVIFWGIGFPVLMAWGLGIAFTSNPDQRKDIAVIEYESPSRLRSFIEGHTSPSWTADSLPSFNLSFDDKVFGKNTFRFIPLSEEQAIEGMKRGKYQLILQSNRDSIFYHLDPANPEARLLQLQLSGIMNEQQSDISLTRANIIPFKLQGTRYIDFLVPGLLALSVMMASMWGISYTIIERRKGNLLRRMIVTPMSKANLMIAHMTARLSMNFVEALILLLFAWIYFDTIVQGSALALFLVFIAGNIAFTGIAVLFSSRTSKTEVGNAIINFVTMPMMILSGVFFSYQNFPEWTIPYIRVLPLTMFVDSIRFIMNEGADIMDVMKNLILLTGMGVVSFAAGIRIFKWY